MNKHDHNPETKNTNTQQINTRGTLRIVVMFYIAYLAYSIFQGYLENRDPLLLAAVAVFAVAEVIFVVVTLRQWKQKRQASALQAETQNQT